MGLPHFSVKKPVTTMMIFCAVILIGFLSWSRIPQELFPPVNYPQLTVVTTYENAAPEEIETQITRIIEEAIGTVSRLRRVSSISKEGVSIVIAEFIWGTNMDFAALGLREKIDLIKERLPIEAEEPIVKKFNPFDLPVISLSVTAEDTHPARLREITEIYIEDELEKVDQVASASVTGGMEREILVQINQDRLQASGLPIMDVVNAITPKNDRVNNEYPGDPILDMSVTGIPGSLLPPPQPTPIPKAPELTGGRPLANIPFEEKGFIYQKAPAMVINVNKSYTAVFKTTKGDIHFELNAKDAPVHVNNFYVLVKLGYYDNFPITNVLRARYAVTGTPDKTPQSDIGYALPAEVKMKQVQGTLCAWLHAKRDKERSSSGSMIAMIMTNAPGGINAFTYFGITDKAGLEIVNTLTTGDIINKVEIIVK